MMSEPRLRLYHYWRSSCSWRVRWAFALKGIPCEFVPINLLSDEPESPEYLARNPMGLVPTLEFLDEQGPLRYMAESTAIIEWTEELFPEPRLLPKDPLTRARARQLAQIVNAGTQPIQNLNVTHRHSSDPVEQKNWNIHWIRHGLSAYEKLVCQTAGIYSVGDTLSIADLYLIPQCYNAMRFDVPLSEFPTVLKIHAAALTTAACQSTHPDRYAPKA